MPGLKSEDFYDTDSSDNDENHEKLLSSVSQLDSTQRVKPAQRKEVASEVSEYNLSGGDLKKKNLINPKDLADVLGKKAEHEVIHKKFKNFAEKAKTLPKPLEKPTEERLKRSVGFENVKKQLKRWDAIVTRNALNDHITFPLNDNSMKIQKSSNFLTQFVATTPLEKELAKVLNENNNPMDDEEEENVKTNEFPLTLEEMLEKRKEMAQLRAKLSYKQSKAQRQSRIKSKKYHRLLKHEKLKQQLKEFELLQKTDPEAALKKLAELDKTRAQERASLRHRNTGHWARNLTVRAKYDVETRKVLAEQLKVSRELTQKVSQLDSSDDEEEELVPESSPVIAPQTSSSTENPWALNISKEVQDFATGYKKFWNEKNKEAATKSDNSNEIKVEENVESSNKNGAKEDEIILKGSEKALKVESPKVLKGNKESENVLNVESPKIPNGNKGKKVLKVESPKVLKDNKESENVVNVESAKTLSDNKKSRKRSKSLKKNKKVKVSPKKEKTCYNVYPTSGVWMVETVEDELKLENGNKRKAEDIDSLFEKLNDKLVKKAVEKAKKIKQNLKRKHEREEEELDKNLDEQIDLSLKNTNRVQRPDMDKGLIEGEAEDNIETVNEPSIRVSAGENVSTTTPAIDPKKFLQIKPKRLRTYLPDNVTGDEEALDDEKEQMKIMEEAFGDDDVMAEFNKMKKEEEKSQIVIQTSLPGWGQWTGSGVVQKPKRKKRMMVMNRPLRKDKIKKDIIINENENPHLKNHMVKEVPHPFTSVDAFEANIRAPIGRDWVPETAHQKLIEKPVVTKLGAIIEPMNENEIIRLKKASKSPYQGKQKNKKQ